MSDAVQELISMSKVKGISPSEKDELAVLWSEMSEEDRDSYLSHFNKGKYLVEYDEQLISWMKAGNSYETFGVKVGVLQKTLTNWENSFPSFWMSKKLAYTHCLHYYESILKHAITDDVKTNAKLLIFKLSNTFKELYSDSKKLDGQGAVTVYIDTGINRQPVTIEAQVVEEDLV